jgi:cysteinyl-tRNA synthetase
MIASLIEKGHAYEAEGHVLFSVKSFPDYGCLSRRDPDEMLAGARVEVAPYKQDPGDFILWKPSDEQTPGWNSPWGFGRPGWHIECSAMSCRYLGTVFDVHGGGQDLIFPHHENELAQSRCAHGTSVLARYWMHNGHLTIHGDKMSKSLGNFFTVRDLLAHYPGEVVRLGLLSAHYRQPLDWTQATLDQAKQGLDRLYTALRHCKNLGNGKVDPRVQHALEDDLNVPLAIAQLHDLATALNKETEEAERSRLGSILKASGFLLGLLQQDPESWFHSDLEGSLTPEHIEAQIQARYQARMRKDFAESDRIRQSLQEQGIILEDGPNGTTWRKA